MIVGRSIKRQMTVAEQDGLGIPPVLIQGSYVQVCIRSTSVRLIIPNWFAWSAIYTVSSRNPYRSRRLAFSLTNRHVTRKGDPQRARRNSTYGLSSFRTFQSPTMIQFYKSDKKEGIKMLLFDEIVASSLLESNSQRVINNLLYPRRKILRGSRLAAAQAPIFGLVED